MGKMTELRSGGKDFPVYISKPTRSVRGGIIVIHEVWGLVDHTKDIADRFAKEGYIALAPNLLSEVGITAQLVGELQEELFDPVRRSQAQPKLRKLMAPMQAPGFGEQTLDRVKQCFDYLFDQKEVEEKVSITGFCFGGSYSFSLAVHEPRLKAAIPFYGHADFSVEQLQKIKCPILAFYGEKDENLMSSLPELKAKMKDAGVDFKAKVYKDCGHAFFNDTNRLTYNSHAATDAWLKTKQFLASNAD